MRILPSQIKTDSEPFQANRKRMLALVEDLHQRLAAAREGGGPKYVERHRAQGKLPVRERITRLLDAGTPFLELSPLAATDLYDNDAPGAGIVSGVGRVSGREVMVVANDATVKGGTYYPLTVKKHVRAQRVRSRTGCRACIWSIPAARFTAAGEVFPDREHFGRLQPGPHVRGAIRVPS